jgi:hypothetical protein
MQSSLNFYRTAAERKLDGIIQQDDQYLAETGLVGVRWRQV